MTPFTPARLGKYLLVNRIARGGMAEIFLAKLHGAEGFEKEVVIKKILPEWSADREFLNMLIDEAKLAVRLNHANIVQIYELGQEADGFFIAMEYVPGVDGRRLWEKTSQSGTPLPTEIALHVLMQMLDGLSYAHLKKNERGENLQIIHRDISPQNILLSFDGAVKLTDFGIAKAAQRSTETVTGVHKGKFAYMSPEQANLQDLTQRSDLFSAGIVLYEFLTGRRLFASSSDIQTLDRIRRGEVVFSEGDQIPQQLKEIVVRSLEREPARRFPTAAAFGEELSRFAATSGLVMKREQFADYLDRLFSEEVKQAATSLAPTRIFQATQPPRSRFWWTASGIAAGGLALLLLALFRPFSHRPPVDPVREVRSPTPPAVARAPAGNGSLSVMVRPWGYVSIDGGPTRESPVPRQELPEGPHQVAVFAGEGGKRLSATASIRAGQPTRCMVNFEAKDPALSCR